MTRSPTSRWSIGRATHAVLERHGAHRRALRENLGARHGTAGAADEHMESGRRRLLEKLIREVTRCEALATDHPSREGKRVGEAPPVVALREVATHARAMRPRFEAMVAGHDLIPIRRGRVSTLKRLVIEHVLDAERSFRIALLDLRHGVEVVQILHEVVREDGLFGLRRWSFDWLVARRTLVARVEAQLAWYAIQRSEILLPLTEPPREDTDESATSPSSPGFLDWL